MPPPTKKQKLNYGAFSADLKQQQHKQVQQRRLRELYICGDIWLGVFTFAEPAELGLKLALISWRFDGLVDTHFKTRKWALGLLEVRRAENGTGVHVFKDYYKKQKVGMPLPEGTPPANLVGFERITIRYMDANVIAFLHRIRPLFKAGIAFKVADRRCLNTLADQIFPFVKLIINNITLMHFGDFPFSNGVDLVRHQMEQLQSLVSPTILLNCANLRMIYSMYFFPIGQAMFDWLHTPREDGRPKVLLCPFTRATLDKLKEKFLNATGAVNWIVLFPFIYPDEEEELFVLTNGRTRERMTFGHPFLHPRGNWAIVRAPIARDEKQWAEWEDEAVCGDETIRRNCIDISIPGVDIE